MKRAGLTLIEFLLAFCIFAVIAVSLYATFFNAIALSRKARELDNSFGEIRTVMQTIRMDLDNMVAYTGNKDTPPAFKGDQQSFSLLEPSPDGLVRVNYTLVSPDQAQVRKILIGSHSSGNVPLTIGTVAFRRADVLLRQQQPFALPTETSTSDSDTEIISRLILEGSWKISYGTLDKGQLVWKDQWQESFFPAALRLQATFTDPDQPGSQIPVQQDLVVPEGLWGKR